MLKFSLTLAIIFFSLYISFSQAQDTLSACASNCSQTVGSIAGCSPGQLNQPSCVCTNAQFFGAASGCVWLSCSSDEATTAENFWLGVCAAYQASLSSGSSASPSSSSTGYGGHPSSVPTTTTSPSSYGNSATNPTGSRTTSPYGASGSSSSSSPTSTTSPSSNLAASMPTHAAALIAGGIGVMVAVFV